MSDGKEIEVDANAYVSELTREVKQLKSELLSLQKVELSCVASINSLVDQRLDNKEMQSLTSSVSPEVLDAMRKLVDTVIKGMGADPALMRYFYDLKANFWPHVTLNLQLVVGYNLREMEAREELNKRNEGGKAMLLCVSNSPLNPECMDRRGGSCIKRKIKSGQGQGEPKHLWCGQWRKIVGRLREWKRKVERNRGGREQERESRGAGEQGSGRDFRHSTTTYTTPPPWSLIQGPANSLLNNYHPNDLPSRPASLPMNKKDTFERQKTQSNTLRCLLVFGRGGPGTRPQ
eukprot:753572-Hanusia_phi.AAC.7